jgi:photosynthetic reaction center cytochrome c subunit
MKIVVAFSLAASVAVSAQQPPATSAMVDTPTVKVLTGLTVPEFESEMQLMTQALGLSCGSCHARGNFASDANPRKLAARRMLEMTKTVNQQFFGDYKPLEGQSRLGRITCFTCHQGDTRPKTQE